MKRTTGKVNNRNNIMAGILAIVMGFLMVITGMIDSTLGNPSYGTIINFEREDPAYEKSVDLGTVWDKLGLPASLRAVLKIAGDETTEETVASETVTDNTKAEEIQSDETTNEIDEANTEETATEEAVTNETMMDDSTTDKSSEEETMAEKNTEEAAEEPADQEGFQQTKPVGDDSNYDQYGYVAPENEEELRESGQLVLYTIAYADGSKAYRVFGTYNGGNERFYACDENGNITGIVREIPVTWYGTYNGKVPGTYTLTAQFEGYNYSGKNPTAE